jgi:hypothetical protein
LEGSPTRPGRLLAFEQNRVGEELGSTVEEAAEKILQIVRKAGV